jgi:hypothetical protein
MNCALRRDDVYAELCFYRVHDLAWIRENVFAPFSADPLFGAFRRRRRFDEDPMPNTLVRAAAEGLPAINRRQVLRSLATSSAAAVTLAAVTIPATKPVRPGGQSVAPQQAVGPLLTRDRQFAFLKCSDNSRL